MHSNNDAPPGAGFQPRGTVYGALLNFHAELRALGDQVNHPPYKAAPKAPVLYVKPANTWSANGSPIDLPTHADEVEIGASIAMVVGAPAFDTRNATATPTIAAWVLVNDLSLSHASFFRPPIKYKCLDGFLGLGPHSVPAGEAGDPSRFVLEVHINHQLRQTVRYADMVRDAQVLLADVSAFMLLQEGDLLLLGCDAGRPLARAGDQVRISAPGLPALGILQHTLRAALPEVA